MIKPNINKTENENSGQINSQADAIQLCNRLVNLTADLISVLDRETQLVKKPGTSDFSALTARKQALSVSLMQGMGLLKKNAAFIKKTAPEQVQILKEQQEQFQRSLEVNHCAISAMKAVSEELLQTIANKAAKKRNGPEVYTSDADFQNHSLKNSGPISIDTSL